MIPVCATTRRNSQSRFLCLQSVWNGKMIPAPHPLTFLTFRPEISWILWAARVSLLGMTHSLWQHCGYTPQAAPEIPEKFRPLGNTNYCSKHVTRLKMLRNDKWIMALSISWLCFLYSSVIITYYRTIMFSKEQTNQCKRWSFYWSLI